MPYDPTIHGTFGEWLRGGAPLGQGRTLDVITDDTTWVTRDQVREERREDGSRVQKTRGQLGHIVTRETLPNGRERQHVRINLS